MDQLYADVLAFERSLGLRFAYVLHVGDFGIWPDPSRVDKATRKHDGAGDFSRWVADKKIAPRRTIFIKGNHEDFDWLDAQPTDQILPGLSYLRNGTTIDLDDEGTTIRVGGIGGCFGPSDYKRRSASLQGSERRHYTSDEVERLGAVRGVDVVLLHDAPAGVLLERSAGGGGYSSGAAGLDELLDRLRPRLCLFGHHHVRVTGAVASVPCLGLNKIARPGNLCAIEMHARRANWTLLGDWPS